MGHAMAHRLLRAGYPLKVHTRTKAKARPLLEAGADSSIANGAGQKPADCAVGKATKEFK